MQPVHPNIMGLKHTLEMKERRLLSNREIGRRAKVHYHTVGNLVKGDIALLYLSTLSKLVHYFQNEGLKIQIGDFFDWQGQELASNIGPLIKKLDPTPTDEEVAQDTGIPLSRIRNLVRGNVKRVYLTDLAALLAWFRQREVKIELGDLLREEESERELA